MRTDALYKNYYSFALYRSYCPLLYLNVCPGHNINIIRDYNVQPFSTKHLFGKHPSVLPILLSVYESSKGYGNCLTIRAHFQGSLSFD